MDSTEVISRLEKVEFYTTIWEASWATPQESSKAQELVATGTAEVAVKLETPARKSINN